jgi:hypothetical protein
MSPASNHGLGQDAARPALGPGPRPHPTPRGTASALRSPRLYLRRRTECHLRSPPPLARAPRARPPARILSSRERSGTRVSVSARPGPDPNAPAEDKSSGPSAPRTPADRGRADRRLGTGPRPLRGEAGAAPAAAERGGGGRAAMAAAGRRGGVARAAGSTRRRHGAVRGSARP